MDSKVCLMWFAYSATCVLSMSYIGVANAWQALIFVLDIFFTVYCYSMWEKWRQIEKQRGKEASMKEWIDFNHHSHYDC